MKKIVLMTLSLVLICFIALVICIPSLWWTLIILCIILLSYVMSKINMNKEPETKVTFQIPLGYTNCKIDDSDMLVVSNDNDDVLKIGLGKPKGEWIIEGYHGDKGKFEITLVDELK